MMIFHHSTLDFIAKNPQKQPIYAENGLVWLLHKIYTNTERLIKTAQKNVQKNVIDKLVTRIT